MGGNYFTDRAIDGGGLHVDEVLVRVGSPGERLLVLWLFDGGIEH